MQTSEYLARGHENLRRLLLVLDSQLSRTHSGDPIDHELTQAVLDYVSEYLEGQHNPVEQLVLARLEHHASWLHSLFEEHARALDALRKDREHFAEVLEGVRTGAITDRDELTRVGYAFVAAFRRRLLVEEAEFLPVAAQALDVEDWHSIEASLRTRGIHDDEDERFEARFRELALEVGCDCEYT